MTTKKAVKNTEGAAPLMRIAIDPGHGMGNRQPGIYDSGAVSANGVEEAAVALDYGKALDLRLQALGVATFLTRGDATTDTPVSSRAGAAAAQGCTVFLSLHLNSADEPAAHGTETLFRDDTKDASFARSIQQAVIKANGFRDRGIIQRPDLAVLKFTLGPAALLELGFVSNAHDLSDLLDPNVKTAIIEAIVSVFVPNAVAAPTGDTWAVHLAAAVPEAVLTSETVLSWEDSHPERVEWSAKLLNLVSDNKNVLEQGNPEGFIIGYNNLGISRQNKFWAELLVAMAKFESGWDPTNVYLESSGQNSVGLLQLSACDGSNYHLTPQIDSEDDLKEPLLNLEWGVKIFARLLSRDRVIASGSANTDARGGARYWSVLRVGHKIDQIIALTRRNVGL